MNRNIWAVNANVICIPVNCKGVMGAGLARQCKSRYPDVFQHYKQLCDEETLTYGGLAIIRQGDKLFALIPTKDDWRDKSSLFDVMSMFSKLVVVLRDRIEADDSLSYTVAVPMLGAGLGGLDEKEVRDGLTGICALATESQPRLRFELC